MTSFDFDVVIVGAGVVGLAIAARASKLTSRVLILERNAKIGQETSSRNSEIIHAGIYYTPGSFKARLCVEGAELLYQYCQDNEVPHRRTGKLILAANASEITILEGLLQRAQSNGARGLSLITGAEAKMKEPAINAEAAIYSPQTGIVDSHRLMSHLLNDALAGEAVISYHSEVRAIEPIGGGYKIRVQESDVFARCLVNAAGLAADRVASLVGLDIDALGYRLQFAKGSYFSYGDNSPVSSLIYPVPHHDLAGLGVHGTLDLAGRLRFGPDVEFLAENAADGFDYSVKGEKADLFYESASRMINGLRREAFQADFSGIRPKLRPIAGSAGPRDFVISHEAERGLPGFVNLIGIESPGLTSALAIARVVTNTLESQLN